jgi:hypothetical protein
LLVAVREHLLNQPNQEPQETVGHLDYIDLRFLQSGSFFNFDLQGAPHDKYFKHHPDENQEKNTLGQRSQRLDVQGALNAVPVMDLIFAAFPVYDKHTR